MTNKLYRIPKLEWKKNKDGQYESTNSIFTYIIDCDSLILTCYFTKYVSLGMQICDSIEHGKQLAQEDYEQRMSSGLIKHIDEPIPRWDARCGCEKSPTKWRM